VGQGKPDVKRWLSAVKDLVVEQDQPAAVKQHVLRAEVAMNQAIFTMPGFLDQVIEKFTRLRDLLRGVKIIWLQT
jgi:hypothetical protein